MNKKNILIVDDDRPLSLALKINLEATGDFNVRVENQSVHTIAVAREFKPDVILLDYVMPGSDGSDVSNKLHADPFLKDVPIIMVTALISNAETGDYGSAKRGGHLMVAKPVRLTKLLECIEQVLTPKAEGES